MHVVAAPPSREQLTLLACAVENAKAANVAVVGLATLELIVTDGRTVAATPTVHEAMTLVEPALFATRIENLCAPGVRPVKVIGDTHENAAVLSREQVVVWAPCDVQAIVAELTDVATGGCPTRVTVGSVSTLRRRGDATPRWVVTLLRWIMWLPDTMAEEGRPKGIGDVVAEARPASAPATIMAVTDEQRKRGKDITTPSFGGMCGERPANNGPPMSSSSREVARSLRWVRGDGRSAPMH